MGKSYLSLPFNILELLDMIFGDFKSFGVQFLKSYNGCSIDLVAWFKSLKPLRCVTRLFEKLDLSVVDSDQGEIKSSDITNSKEVNLSIAVEYREVLDVLQLTQTHPWNLKVGRQSLIALARGHRHHLLHWYQVEFIIWRNLRGCFSIFWNEIDNYLIDLWKVSIAKSEAFVTEDDSVITDKQDLLLAQITHEREVLNFFGDFLIKLRDLRVTCNLNLEGVLLQVRSYKQKVIAIHFSFVLALLQIIFLFFILSLRNWGLRQILRLNWRRWKIFIL